uniref:Uncharacterized protein n=1 Tax=Hyaloperonospora arabidopsidis (strain Emoy2) TaxID=559515 RepID=M4B5L9_HYAAE
MLFDSGAEVSILDTTFARKPTEHYVCQARSGSFVGFVDGIRHDISITGICFEREEEVVEEYAGPLVDHPVYEKPTRVVSCPPTEAEDETEILRKSMPHPGKEMTNGSKCRDQSADGSHFTKEDQGSAGTPSAIHTIK